MRLAGRNGCRRFRRAFAIAGTSAVLEDRDAPRLRRVKTDRSLTDRGTTRA